MKKYTILFVLLLAMLISACGQKTQTPTTPATTTVPTEAPTEAPTTAPAEPETELTFGVVENGKYISKTFGFSVDLDPEIWYVATPEELAALNNMTVDAFNDEDLAKKIEQDVVMEFYAQSLDGVASMNMATEKLGLFNLLMDEEALVAESAKVVVPALEGAGFANISWEPVTLDVHGKTVYGLNIEFENQGIPVFETVFMRKSGSYATSVTLASYYEDYRPVLLDFIQIDK